MTIKLIISKLARINWKGWLFIFTLIVAMALGYISGKTVKENYTSNQTSFNSEFNVEYFNANKKGKIRYKYALDYEVEDVELIGKMSSEEPLFSLIHNGNTVLSKYPTFNNNAVIPEVSGTIEVDEGQAIIDEYSISYSSDVDREIIDNVLFEAFIGIERFHKGKWEPEYNTTFIKRGPMLTITNSPA